MSWNYRLLRHSDGDDWRYKVVEAYYNGKERIPNGFCAAHPLIVDSPQELAQTLNRIARAAKKPPLELVDGKIVELDGDDGTCVSEPSPSPAITVVIDLLKDMRARLLEYVRDDVAAAGEGGGLYGSQAAAVAAPYIARIDALLGGEQHG